ncbi:MAG: 4-(cytidine 5'-diphospho)-2-C-methyl-D-erythritol kinase [Firmicutes bacterium]|nr:4-(cytidine 5'-diphospho)-2-C-methyl-D-erythritol kinase [Bacillota bacterium]
MSVYYSAAKINLFLQVEGILPNGYHELTSVMQSVSLFDRVEVLFGQEDYALDCGGLDLGPAEKNIVTRMWRLLKDRYDLPQEVHITLKKQIPVGAGLAGGSGNGAAVLRAVIDHFDLAPSKEEIVEIAAKIGADVAFCYFGGTMLATGIGEKLKKLPAMPHWDLLLFNGGFHVSTPEMFRAYDDIALGVEKVPVDMMVHALEKGSKDGILYSLYNGLEKVTYPRYAHLRRLSDRLDELFLPHLMSGSGPTVFALAEPKVAKNLLKNPEKELGKDFGKVYHAVPLGQGVFSEQEYAAWVKNYNA